MTWSEKNSMTRSVRVRTELEPLTDREPETAIDSIPLLPLLPFFDFTREECASVSGWIGMTLVVMSPWGRVPCRIAY